MHPKVRGCLVNIFLGMVICTDLVMHGSTSPEVDQAQQSPRGVLDAGTAYGKSGSIARVSTAWFSKLRYIGLSPEKEIFPRAQWYVVHASSFILSTVIYINNCADTQFYMHGCLVHTVIWYTRLLHWIIFNIYIYIYMLYIIYYILYYIYYILYII